MLNFIPWGQFVWHCPRIGFVGGCSPVYFAPLGLEACVGTDALCHYF